MGYQVSVDKEKQWNAYGMGGGPGWGWGPGYGKAVAKLLKKYPPAAKGRAMTGPAWRIAATLTLVFVSSWPALRLIRPLSTQEALSVDAEIDTAPVELDGEVLFRTSSTSTVSKS